MSVSGWLPLNGDNRFGVRCTGYIPIVEAVLEARAVYRKTDKP
jgi:hypothetical protein